MRGLFLEHRVSTNPLIRPVGHLLPLARGRRDFDKALENTTTKCLTALPLIRPVGFEKFAGPVSAEASRARDSIREAGKVH